MIGDDVIVPRKRAIGTKIAPFHGFTMFMFMVCQMCSTLSESLSHNTNNYGFCVFSPNFLGKSQLIGANLKPALKPLFGCLSSIWADIKSPFPGSDRLVHNVCSGETHPWPVLVQRKLQLSLWSPIPVGIKVCSVSKQYKILSVLANMLYHIHRHNIT